MRKTQKERFYVTVHVMPYVQRYMTDNYGVRDAGIKNRVDMRRDPLLMAEFLPRLKKKPLSNSPRGGEGVECTAIAKRRTAIVNIEISQTTFERRGWELSALLVICFQINFYNTVCCCLQTAPTILIGLKRDNRFLCICIIPHSTEEEVLNNPIIRLLLCCRNQLWQLKLSIL